MPEELKKMKNLHRHRFLLLFLDLNIWLKNKLGINKSFGIGKILMKYNIVDSLPPSINGKMRNRLSGFYKKDIELLSELINKDFSKWLL